MVGAAVDPAHAEVGLGQVLFQLGQGPLRYLLARPDILCPLSRRQVDGIGQEANRLTVGEVAQRRSARPAQVVDRLVDVDALRLRVLRLLRQW